ncbi:MULTISPECIES: methylenetetrahydrofolate--tRNA-(uracil(54)-C(5))-methyltransferase (FADH(2)-oxidizing) TrmFO [unclassified Thermosipho (in: thermotogales)]|uniref:methylenetetrahydrofolate--tRNA-(uracil(54)- C(5))-methyltransferase (FADH(2)-oxidizing) TrmFO n=1 Tax=unclassified Thermosipho (in: thermotogales) TaxID=2676525 RepID=UPI0009842713|nr:MULTISPECIES: methylenetetrahydrofolate--tRNA-(uracil(54)-C(5))-methyltransferase (FADH(2)-oxidizing) TrmFO [unclassified Thermosipho (in: thermotogales)]MBT1248481.1 tRNA (uracil-5-)-methyltransferase [Thermosipho sp. 1244]OOC47252.1 tRNA (uracil-5-)-methyltransferase [Thermosipho sp. 1223]
MVVNIVGGGLAGVEVAWKLLKKGIKVRIFEQKPKKFSPVHRSEYFAELVCSNSLKSESLKNAEGILKAEMRLLDSLVLECAYKNRVPAGKALAVDRKAFSKCITDAITSFDNVEIIREEVEEIKINDEIWVVATGPTTDGNFANWLSNLTGGFLNFFDAVAPIISGESINFDKCFFADRYGQGTKDYVNCPMTKEEYERFYTELVNAQMIEMKDFDRKLLFERCQPIEEIAKSGEKSLIFGPLKPVGLIDPHTGKMPYAVIQLRREDESGNMYNLVGFQTRLKWKEQERVIRLIPGLENAEILRYGVMHRNTYIDSPKVLDEYLRHKKYENLFFAGQIVGVEGYVESAATGIYVGINISRFLEGKAPVKLSKKTMLGALLNYVTMAKNLKPMYANFGLVDVKMRKKEKREKLHEFCLEQMRKFVNVLK